MDEVGKILEVDGHRYVHTIPSEYVVTYLGEERLNLASHLKYDIMGNNLAKEYNVYNALEYANWSLENMHIPIITVSVYMLLIYFGQKWMECRPQFQIKKQLIYWNLSLSIFSIIGVFYTAPHLMGMLYHGGLEYSVCAPAEGKYAHGNVAFWGTLFAFSKFPELIDTLFIVLRKRRVIFLHWYHHVTVLCYCWHGFATRASNTIFFMVMNYTVHGVMYFYYFLTAQGYRPSWAKFVTIIQISQMFLGVQICAMTYYYWHQGKQCDVSVTNFIGASLMYFSYLLLFVWFALKKYVFMKSKKVKKADKAKKVKKVDNEKQNNKKQDNKKNSI